MKQKFRMYQRGLNGRFYLENNETGKQESLGTSNKTEALRLLHARNEAEYQPAFNAQMARAYLVAKDALIGKRTWQFVMDEMKRTKVKHAPLTSERYESAFNETHFDALRHLTLIETRPDVILKVLMTGTVSTNVFMRRLHSFALNMGWLPWPILAYAQWPRLKYKTRRAITADEAQRLLDVEPHPEWRAFLQLLWHVGAAQVDMSGLTHENIDWQNRLISYTRKKTGTLAVQRFGTEAEAILRERPSIGPLFPHFGKQDSAARATRFADRCQKLGIVGVSLHSYRYAWAERARQAGYPERFAQEALGHTSAAVHRAYAKGAKVNIPSLEEYEQRVPVAEAVAA
jgi:integrase